MILRINIRKIKQAQNQFVHRPNLVISPGLLFIYTLDLTPYGTARVVAQANLYSITSNFEISVVSDSKSKY